MSIVINIIKNNDLGRSVAFSYSSYIVNISYKATQVPCWAFKVVVFFG